MGNQNSAVRLTAPVRCVCPAAQPWNSDVCAHGHQDANLTVPAPTQVPISQLFIIYLFGFFFNVTTLCLLIPPIALNGNGGWTGLLFQALGVCYTDPVVQVF